MHKSIRAIAICLLTLFSIGSIEKIKATLVIALDLTQSKTIRDGIPNHKSYYQKQIELETKLRDKLGIKGIMRVQTPHITLFSGIADTPQNRNELISVLNTVAPLLKKRIYINITDLSTLGHWNGYYFYIALNAAIQQHKYNGQQSLSQQKLLETIEKELMCKNVNYKKGSANHTSLVEVHSRSGGKTSDYKRNLINDAIGKSSSPLHYPNNFRLSLPASNAIWINNITLYCVTRQGNVDIAQDFNELYQVLL